MDWIGIGLVAVICLAIGYIAASLLGNLRSPVTPSLPEDTAGGDDRVEVVRLLRDPEGGIQPEMGGQALPSASALSAEQHATISLALVDLYTWMEEGNQPPPKLEKPVPPPKSKPAGEPQDPAPKPVKAPGLNVFKAIARTAQSEVKQKIETAPLSLAAEIDEILQEKLDNSPLEGKGIRLMDLPKQGMVIMIGLEKYQDVEAVPDEAIKELIHEAVAEWEARSQGEGRPG